MFRHTRGYSWISTKLMFIQCQLWKWSLKMWGGHSYKNLNLLQYVRRTQFLKTQTFYNYLIYLYYTRYDFCLTIYLCGKVNAYNIWNLNEPGNLLSEKNIIACIFLCIVYNILYIFETAGTMLQVKYNRKFNT